MINVDIDTRTIASQFNLDATAVDGLLEYTVDQLTGEFAYLWAQEAKVELKSARNEFLSAIQVGKRGRFTGVAYLNPAAWLPNALEMGMSAFDMKPGFLASSKTKLGKDGPYLTIPFRFAQAGSVGESSAFSGVLPSEVQKAVKSNPQQPLSLSKIPSKYQIPKSSALRKRQESVTFRQIQQKQTTSIYEGLKKSKGGYVNFRRVSVNSSADRFQHPGFQARDLASKALAKLDINNIVGSAIDDFLVNLGF